MLNLLNWILIFLLFFFTLTYLFMYYLKCAPYLSSPLYWTNLICTHIVLVLLPGFKT